MPNAPWILAILLCAPAVAQNQLRISQVYGGGGNAGSVWKNDFVEIYNAGPTAVNLSTYSVQYAASTAGTWAVTNLSGSIAPNRYYLVQEAVGAGGTTALPAADATGVIAMSATAGKVALASSQTALSGACPTVGVLDFVGYGGATPNCFEGAAAVAALANTTAGLRAGAGCTDTNTNSTDFSVVSSISPRNSAAAAVACLASSGSSNPTPVAAGGTVNLSATIAPSAGPASTGITATCDLTQIGGATAVALPNISGTTYGVAYLVPPEAIGSTYVLPCQSLDAQNRGTPFGISVQVSGGSTAPGATGSATPNPVTAPNTVALNAAVTPGAGPASSSITLTCNLSVLGGGASVNFPNTGGNNYGVAYAVPLSVAANTYTVNCTVADDLPRSSNFSFGVTVVNNSTNPSATGSASPASVAAGSSTLLSAVLTPGTNPPPGSMSAACNLSAIGGGTAVALPVNYTIPNGTATTPYNLPCTVTDDLNRSAPFTIALTVTAAPATPRRIFEITGAGAVSPLAGARVQVTGVITAQRATGSGFYMESLPADRDADPNTSDGILVFTNGSNPACAAIGNLIQIDGTVQDFYPTATAPAGSVPITEIASPANCLTLSANALGSLPAPVTIDAAFATPAGPATQSRKAVGMRVAIPVATVVSPSLGNLTETSAQSTIDNTYFVTVQGVARGFRASGIQDTRRPSDAPATVPAWNGAPQVFRVDTNALSPAANATEIASGATVTGIAGVMELLTTSGQYQIYTDAAGAGTLSPAAPTLAAMPVPPALPTDLTIANANIERFYNDLNDANGNSVTLTTTAYQGRLNKLSLAIRTVLLLPDILVLEEVEGPKVGQGLNTPVLNDIVNKINADAGSTVYAGCESYANDPSAIAIAMLYKPAKVGSAICNIYGTNVNYNLPGGGNNTLLDRPPLVLSATVTAPGSDSGIPIRIVGNHLKALTGIDEPGVANGERVRTKRNEQGKYVANLLTGNLPGEQTTNWNLTGNLLVTGDFNSFDINDGYADVIGCISGSPAPASQIYATAAQNSVSPPCTAVPTLSLSNITAADPLQRYSYSFSGVVQRIDHLLVNAKLAPRVRQFTYARNNADFPEGPTYRNNFNRPERVSDHDWPLMYLTLPMEVTSHGKLNATSFVLNRQTQRYSTTLSVTNQGTVPMNGPIYVLFTSIPAGVSIPGASTLDGQPYVTINLAGPLAPGATSPGLTVGFANPFNVPIAYTTKRFDGSF